MDNSCVDSELAKRLWESLSAFSLQTRWCAQFSAGGWCLSALLTAPPLLGTAHSSSWGWPSCSPSTVPDFTTSPCLQATLWAPGRAIRSFTGSFEIIRVRRDLFLFGSLKLWCKFKEGSQSCFLLCGLEKWRKLIQSEEKRWVKQTNREKERWEGTCHYGKGASKAPRGVITGVWKYQHKLMGNIHCLHIDMVTII